MGLACGCATPAEKASNSTAAEESVATSTAAVVEAVVPTAQMVLTYTIPQARDTSKIAVAANGVLTLGNDVTVLDAAGGAAQLTSTGAGQSNFSTNIRIGELWNQGNLFLAVGDNIQGNVYLGGALSPTPQVNVTTGPIKYGKFATQSVSRTVNFPTQLVTLKEFAANTAEQKLAPGAYQYGNIRPQAKVVLSSGTYYFDSFTLESGATLILDQSNGPISIYVKSSLMFKGTTEIRDGGPATFLMGYFGQSEVSMEGALAGTLIAPNAKVTLRRTTQAHRGSVVGRDVEIQASAALTYIPYTGWLIDDVTVDKPTVCQNEPVTLTVSASSAGTGKVPVVSIGGLPGTTRTLQFGGAAGPRRVAVVAGVAGGPTSVRDVVVNVTDCAAGTVYAAIGFGPNPFHENTVDLVVRNPTKLGRTAPEYIWDFGDGKSATTTVPYVNHDYTAALGRDVEFNPFNVTLTVRESGKPDLVSKKSLTVANLYAFNKRRGTIQPPVQYSPELSKSGTNLTNTLNVKNLEDQPVTLTQKIVELVSCTDTTEPTVLSTTTEAISVAAKSTLAVPVSVPSSALSSDTCGVNVYFKGKSASNLSVVVSANFEAKERARHPVTGAAKKAILRQIVEQNLVSNPDRITDEDIYRLAAEGRISGVPAEETSMYDGPQAKAGEECTPGDAANRPGFTCQAAFDNNGNPEFVTKDALIANALKGDVIMSHACGFVGAMLSKLNPPQIYTHTGIMIRNQTRLRHATAAQARYENSNNQEGWKGSNGVKENVLKYGWPGTITQTVGGAYMGEAMVDPDGVVYSVSAFNGHIQKCDSDTMPITPGVLKAPIGSGAAGRAPLLSAADAAEHTTSMGNYRFYAYTRADLASQSSAPSSTGWASGSNGVMCSSFCWTAFKKAGVTLEGSTLEGNDLGAELNGAPDGLYFYTQDERYAAGIALRDAVANKVWDTADSSFAGNGGADAPDNWAHQMVHCFLSDECQVNTNEDDAWEDDPSKVGTGYTVAPDNLAYWDVFEPAIQAMVYRASEQYRVYRWQPSAGTGTVTGTVLMPNGTGADHAQLTIAGIDTESDGSGQFSFVGVPQGSYQLDGLKVVNGMVYKGYIAVVTVASGSTQNVVLHLDPDERYRRIVINGAIHIHEDETWPYDEDSATVTITNDSVFLNPNHLTETIHWSGCAGGELRGDVSLTLTLDTATQAVTGILNTNLYEYDTCGNNELDGQGSVLQVIPKGSSMTFDLPVHNTDEDVSDDYVNTNISVANLVETISSP
jgi:hypothetical protein